MRYYIFFEFNKVINMTSEFESNEFSWKDNKPHKQYRKYTCTLDDIYL